MSKKPKKYHFIYKTTCIKTGRFYIGMHSTDEIGDGYIGSGQRLWHSIRYHGIENHQMEILEFCQDRKSLAIREREIVNEELLGNSDCMNLCLGGEIGFTKDQRSKGAINANNKNWKSPEFIKKIKAVASNTMKNLWANPEYSKKFKEAGSKAFEGKTHTEQTKKSIGQKNSVSQKGESNSQFGTCWITNGTENKKIRKDSSIPTGWWNGRKQKPDLT